jgi:hypothetical protein
MEPILQERVNIVRQYEVQCYSMCYYLLQDEQQAIKAAQEVMTLLIREDALCLGSGMCIEQYIKKESIKQSLQIVYS